MAKKAVAKKVAPKKESKKLRDCSPAYGHGLMTEKDKAARRKM